MQPQKTIGRVTIKLTKLEKAIIESIRTARLGLPDWSAVAKNEGLPLDYLMQRLEWLRSRGII
jgi:hypothetical protein